jgi:hypothetical protein
MVAHSLIASDRVEGMCVTLAEHPAAMVRHVIAKSLSQGCSISVGCERRRCTRKEDGTNRNSFALASALRHSSP